MRLDQKVLKCSRMTIQNFNCNQIDCLPQIISTPYPENHPGKVTSKISKKQWISTPQWPPASPRDPGNYLQHQISISFQFLSPGSSTKSASSFYHQVAAPNQLPVSTTRQQHQISFQFHHQAAASNQLPVSTTRQQHHISQPPARHSTSQLLTLPPCHTHTMAARSVVV